MQFSIRPMCMTSVSEFPFVFMRRYIKNILLILLSLKFVWSCDCISFYVHYFNHYYNHSFISFFIHVFVPSFTVTVTIFLHTSTILIITLVIQSFNSARIHTFIYLQSRTRLTDSWLHLPPSWQCRQCPPEWNTSSYLSCPLWWCSHRAERPRSAALWSSRTQSLSRREWRTERRQQERDNWSWLPPDWKH